MIPLRLVIDTNVVVSAALNRDGLPRTVLTVALTKPARLYISSEIFAEYRAVLRRPALKIGNGQRNQLLALISNRSHIVKPRRSLHMTIDPDDNRFLECADAARADYLLTGNQQHFPRFWNRTKIISPREFMEVVGPHFFERPD
jgi:putative PIN family toxin of toxin-antitoxin system